MAHAASELKQIPVKQIFVPEVRRKSFDKKDEKIQMFINSVEKIGFVNPIDVRPELDGKYELVCGPERLWIAKQLGWETVPCVVSNWTDEQIDFVALSENVHRQQMTPQEHIRQIQMLMRAFEKAFGKDPKQAAGGIARAKTAIRKGGQFAKAEKSSDAEMASSSLPSLSPPATSGGADAGGQASERAGGNTPPTCFTTMIIGQTGRAETSVREDMELAQHFTDRELDAIEKVAQPRPTCSGSCS